MWSRCRSFVLLDTSTSLGGIRRMNKRRGVNKTSTRSWLSQREFACFLINQTGSKKLHPDIVIMGIVSPIGDGAHTQRFRCPFIHCSRTGLLLNLVHHELHYSFLLQMLWCIKWLVRIMDHVLHSRRVHISANNIRVVFVHVCISRVWLVFKSWVQTDWLSFPDPAF